MKTLMNTKLTLGAVAVLASSNSAFAHPGEHSALITGQLVEHLAGSPFHLAFMAGAGLLGTLLVWGYQRRKQSSSLSAAKAKVRTSSQNR